MEFRFQEVAEWPPLAWIAKLVPGEDAIHVTHGSRVEVGPDWFCEATWAGDWQDADFDQTDLVFGSGARLRNGAAMFVSSGTTIDRLQWIQTPTHTWVSNSLVCLMKHADAAVDVTYRGYYGLFKSITKGLDKYERVLPTTSGPVNLVYFNNLRWDGRGVTEIEKPHSVAGFEAFADFRAYLQSAIDRIGRNLADAGRRFPYAMLGTISSGYDSATVATLAHPAGLTDVISFHRVLHGIEDCGHEVARALGVKLSLVDREDWRKSDLPEVPFVAADGGGEDVFFRGAENWLAGRVLLSGYHGDKVWDKNTKIVGPNIVRGDRSGLSQSEYRLWVGYLNCAVPFMGARHHADIHRINNSPEMTPWDVGGDYTRPICRRIVEEAGVPRSAFGVKKIGSSVEFMRKHNLQSDSTMADYSAWLREQAGAFWRRRSVPPHVRQAVLAPAQWVLRKGGWGVNARAKKLPTAFNFVRFTAHHLGRLGDKEHLSNSMFPWAIDRAQRRYPIPAQAAAPSRAPAPRAAVHDALVDDDAIPAGAA